MPKITVNEKDLSWYYRQRDPSALTVYMPILASDGPEEPTLCDSTNFKSTYGSSIGVANDISYDMAASFIDAGLNVLAHRVIPDGAVEASANIIKAPDTSGTTGANKVKVTAKFPGTGGNKLSIKGVRIPRATGDTTSVKFMFYIKNEFGVSAIFSVDFASANSSNEDYYEKVNETSDFVKFEFLSGVTTLEDTDVFASINDDGVPQYINLTGGLNYGSTSDPLADVRTAITTEGFLNDISDPYLYSFDVVVDGGFGVPYSAETPQPEGTSNYTTLTAVDSVFKNLVTTCKDAIYLVSAVAGLPHETFFSYCNNFNSSYCAGYGPWGYAQLLSNGVTKNLPGYYALLVSWANAIAAGNPVWMAPAGVKRSQLGTFYRRPEYEVGQTILNTWQNHEDIGSEVKYKVNPIMKLKQYGYCVYGNSTLLQDSGNGSTSMLQSFGTRVLANQIKKQAFDISLNLQFDQLTPDLFAQFKTLLGIYMDQLRYQGALYDYDIVADYSAITSTQLNTKTVPVIIKISPNPAAENFEISLEISQAGVSFSDESVSTTEA